mmetsp:Transcript_7663/g.27268  ORF Transcript_7663/g.27268 Transcript_7663/m.27268 type:complete len:263 (-) Transcript_7663:2960-3748(-)
MAGSAKMDSSTSRVPASNAPHTRSSVSPGSDTCSARSTLTMRMTSRCVMTVSTRHTDASAASAAGSAEPLSPNTCGLPLQMSVHSCCVATRDSSRSYLSGNVEMKKGTASDESNVSDCSRMSLPSADTALSCTDSSWPRRMSGLLITPASASAAARAYGAKAAPVVDAALPMPYTAACCTSASSASTPCSTIGMKRSIHPASTTPGPVCSSRSSMRKRPSLRSDGWHRGWHRSCTFSITNVSKTGRYEFPCVLASVPITSAQ